MYKNLVIVGGGFAGTKTAQLLEHTLAAGLDPDTDQSGELHHVQPASPRGRGRFDHAEPRNRTPPSDAALQSRLHGAGHRYRYHRTAWCSISGKAPVHLRYDQLVLACGTNANLDIVKGMAQSALPLKTIGDALFLRNRIIARLEQAELQPDPEHRRWLMSFIVVGGGFSGVETAGELVDFLYSSLKYYKRIRRDDLRITLLHSGDRLLQELSPSLGRFTLRKMMDREVDVRLNARAVRVTDRDVHLESGELISGGTVVCTIGTQPNTLLDCIPTMKSRGRLVVNPDMSVPGVRGGLGHR